MRHESFLDSPLPSLAAVIAVAFCVGPGHALSGATSCSIDGDGVTVILEANSYEVTATPAGQRLTMEDFDYLKIPGRPLLPMKRFLIALPPGAQAESVEILSTRTSELSGTYQVAPSGPIMLLPGMPRWEEAMQRMQQEREADHAAVYSSDAPFPPKAAWIAGKGTLRKYSYAAVAFCPFTYYPKSGRLEYHSEVRVVIRCGWPLRSESEARLLDQIMLDRVADERAVRLFSNYQEVADLYSVQGPQLPLPDESYDYVIITTGELQEVVASTGFVQWKTNLGHNVRTVLTTDSEITGQPGIDLAERIRNFLRSYYASWSIEYVLFVGDYATVPMRICYPDPDFHVYNPSNPGLVAPGTPTDCYYADLSYPDAISWDSDGDGYLGEYSEDFPDFLAEVAVGRIPADDPYRIAHALDKAVSFEQDHGAWKANVLHAGAILFFENQDHGDYPFIDGATCLDSMETALMSDCNISHLSEQSGLVTSLYDWPPLRESSFTTLWGTGDHAIVNWSGHGWCDGAYRTIWSWDDGDGIPESANGELQSHRFVGVNTANLDDDHPSIVFAISCNVGYPEPYMYGNLGIDLLTLPGWGASAGIVSSARPAAVSGDWKNDPGGTEQICYDFNRYMIVEGERIGDALYDGKFHATNTYGWDRVYEYMNLYNFNLFGDPALEVHPRTTAVLDTDRPDGVVLSFSDASPNPFGSGTTLRFVLSERTSVLVTVHDIGGRNVATLAGGNYPPGEYGVAWDGRGEDGERLGSGLYFVILDAADQRVSRKLMLLR